MLIVSSTTTATVMCKTIQHEILYVVSLTGVPPKVSYVNSRKYTLISLVSSTEVCEVLCHCIKHPINVKNDLSRVGASINIFHTGP